VNSLYNRLWILLINKGIKRKDLRQNVGLTTNVMAHLGKDEPVTMDALGKICKALNCRIEDIVEYIPDEEPFEATQE